MKEKLLALLKTKNERKSQIASKSEKCEDINELRGYNAELDSLNEEIRQIQELIDGIKEEKNDDPDLRTAAVNGQIPAVVKTNAETEKHEEKSDDKYASKEYRMAFMDYCIRGTEIPAEYRSDAFTAVSDAAAVIPTNIMNELIKEMKSYGQIYSRCRLTSIPGGVQVPILSLKPTATRITEASTSDRKKIQANTYVTFGYFGLECKVATSLLASIVSLAIFEAEIVPLITEAMISRIEYEVFKGTGSGMMLGITVDTRVQASQKITLTADEFTSWEAWKKKVFAKIPISYRNYAIYMGAGTFDGYIDGMTDANGQPIGRTNYGITDGIPSRFSGKEVVEVEEDIITSYDNASSGDVVAVFVNLKDYAINSNMQMAMFRWLDHDTNQYVDKAILINDGKLLDAAGVIIVKKG
jgi:HK97 family phage major capsid protein